MPGPFDNESGKHLDSSIYAQGHWFLSLASRNLYIVPDDEEAAEIEGPDDQFLDALNSHYATHRFDTVDPRELALSLGMQFVEQPQRRFDPNVGYFHA